MKSLRNEFLQIFKERKLSVAIAAMLVIPVLYAGMFLWAFWDPYDHLPDLPIAVVNEDVGVDDDGEFLHLGDELIDNLKDESDFDFQFVDKAIGYEGLENEDYYILIEIPEVFSKNALTVMDDNPKKAPLKYVPNESYNFLAAQIGETTMLQIEVALQEKITETYAETIFDNISEVSDGLVDASDATIELHDGATELLDGTNEISENLHTLASKSLEFSGGIAELSDGTNTLIDGSQELESGINQLTDASDKLLDASGDIREGASDLASGISSANQGVKDVKENFPSLIKGTNDVKAGLTDFQNQLPGQMAAQINGQISKSATEMEAGLDQLEAAVTTGLEEDLANGLTKGLSEHIIATSTAQTEQLAEILLQSGVDQEVVQGVLEDLKKNAPEEKDIAAQLKPQIQGAIVQSVEKIDTGFTTYSQTVNDKLTGATSGLESSIETAINPVFDDLIAGITQVNQGQTALQSGVSDLADGTAQLQTGSNSLVSGQKEYVSQLDTFTTKMQDANNGVATLANGTTTLADGIKQLNDGALQLNDGTEKLADGSDELQDGISTLVEGTDEFKGEMQSAADKAGDISATDKTYNMFASPVEVTNDKINHVPNYGTGFAPYFLSLGLFVGALLLSIVFPLRDPVGTPKNAFQWFFSKFGVIFAIGIIQALIASGVLLLGLGLEVQSVPLFLLFAIITSLVFVTLIQFLVTCFADPGRFAAILILIMQLTTSAGTFPLELIPKALQPISNLLPMTYSVSGMKAVISSGNYSVMWQNAGILIGFTIVFMLLTYSYFAVMFKRKFGKNQED